MNKKDLKDGYVVKLRSNVYGYVNLSRGIIILNDGFLELDKYNDDLTRMFRSSVSEDYDIMAIYEPHGFGGGFSGILSEECKHFCSEVLIREESDDIDWTKVPKWTKVQVKDKGYEEWKNRYFFFYDIGTYATYPFATAETKKDEFTLCEPKTEGFKHCRIHPDVEIKEEWYKK